MAGEYPEISLDWKYYNDYKSWLLKASLKKRTVFWGAAGAGFFSVTVYFKTAAETDITESGLPDDLKSQFAATRDKRFHGLILKLAAKKDIPTAMEMLAIKQRFQ